MKFVTNWFQKTISSYHGKQWHNSCSHFRASASCLDPFYTPETTIITPLFKYLQKKQNETTVTTVVFQPIDFRKHSKAKLFWGQLFRPFPSNNQPSEVISASSCKVDDGIAEVMPRLARSKFPLVPKVEKMVRKGDSTSKMKVLFVRQLGENTVLVWGETWIEEYGISYQYDIDTVKEKLQRLHALFSFDTLGHSQIAIGQTVPVRLRKKIRTLAKQSAS